MFGDQPAGDMMQLKVFSDQPAGAMMQLKAFGDQLVEVMLQLKAFGDQLVEAMLQLKVFGDPERTEKNAENVGIHGHETRLAARGNSGVAIQD